jgi:hypothetical protein
LLHLSFLLGRRVCSLVEFTGPPDVSLDTLYLAYPRILVALGCSSSSLGYIQVQSVRATDWVSHLGGGGVSIEDASIVVHYLIINMLNVVVNKPPLPEV